MSVSNIIKAFDYSSQPLSLNYHNIQHYQSKTGGILSLCYLFIAISILSFKTIDLVQRNHLTVSSQVSKERFFEPINLSQAHFRILVCTNKQCDQRINQQNQYEYGVNITVRVTNINMDDGIPNVTSEQYKMKQCPDYDVNSSSWLLCIPDCVNLTLFGRQDVVNQRTESDGPNYQVASVNIFRCDQTLQQCGNYSQDLSFYVVFNVSSYFEYQKNQSNITLSYASARGYQQYSDLKINQHHNVGFQFDKIQIYTDYSIMPDFLKYLTGAHNQQHEQIKEQYHKNVDSWLFDEVIETDLFPRQVDSDDQNAALLSIYLYRSIYTHTYIRHYKKIDQMLGQYFGIAGILSFIVFLSYRGYNRWSFKQVRKKVRNQEYQMPTLCNYYKSLICLCCKKRQVDSKINQQNLDYHQLLMRMQKIQKIIYHQKFQQSQVLKYKNLDQSQQKLEKDQQQQQPIKYEAKRNTAINQPLLKQQQYSNQESNSDDRV